MKKILLLGILTIATSVGSTFAESTFMSSEGLLSLSAPIGANLYAAGQSVQLSQAVGGDAIVAGAEIRIIAPVQNDLWSAGSNISIDASVAGDVRAAAGNVFVNKDVGGDLLVAAGNVLIAPGVTIGGDLIVGGGKVDMHGTVKGNAKLGAENLTLAGTINGNIESEFNKATIVTGASVGGSIKYKAPTKNTAIEGLVKTGSVEYGILKDHENFNKGDRNAILWGLVTSFVLYKWLVYALFATIMVLVWRKFFVGIANTLRRKPRKSLLTGFLVYAATPIAILLLAITVVGLPVAGILALLYGVLILVSGMASSAIIASWFIEKFWGGLQRAPRWKILIAIIVVGFLFAVISGIDLIAVFFAMGAAMIYKFGLMKRITHTIEE